MKKLIALILAFCCMLCMAACDEEKQTKISVYSLSGEHDYFRISNGVIVFGDTEEIVDGGELKVTQEELFSEITSYTVTLYVRTSDGKRTLLSNSVIDQTGGTLPVSGDVGKMSGQAPLFDYKMKETDEWANNLWLELQTTGLSGQENTYQLQLSVNEITS